MSDKVKIFALGGLDEYGKNLYCVDINDDILEVVNTLLENIQNDLFEKAKKRRDDLTFVAHNLEEVEKIVNTQPGFIKAMWCGDVCCEEKMKELRGIKSRCIVDGEKVDDCCVVCGKPAKELVIWGIQY